MQLRKRVGVDEQRPEADAAGWLPLEQLAEVIVSSEDPSAPIEGALIQGVASGWRAATPGEQTLRVRFDQPQDLSIIHLVFEEMEHERLQEFTVRWSDDGGRTLAPIVRQQFFFSPTGATREVESYNVNLRAVTDLDLHIVPDLSQRGRYATLTALRVR